MITTDSYRNHLMMLEEIKRVIQSLKSNLYTMEQRYKQQIDASEAAGFMQAYTSQLRIMQQQFQTKIENLLQIIEKHEAQLEQQKEVIQQFRDSARNNQL